MAEKGLDYIGVAVSLPSHQKIAELADVVGEDGAGWYLITLWCWAAQHCPEGKLSISERRVEIVAGWHGKPGRLVAALVDCRLLDRCEDGGFVIHGWDEPGHNGATFREVRRTRERVAQYKEEKRQEREAGTDTGTRTHTVPGSRTGTRTRSRSGTGDATDSDSGRTELNRTELKDLSSTAFNEPTRSRAHGAPHEREIPIPERAPEGAPQPVSAGNAAIRSEVTLVAPRPPAVLALVPPPPTPEAERIWQRWVDLRAPAMRNRGTDDNVVQGRLKDIQAQLRHYAADELVEAIEGYESHYWKSEKRIKARPTFTVMFPPAGVSADVVAKGRQAIDLGRQNRDPKWRDPSAPAPVPRPALEVRGAPKPLAELLGGQRPTFDRETPEQRERRQEHDVEAQRAKLAQQKRDLGL